MRSDARGRKKERERERECVCVCVLREYWSEPLNENN